MSTSDLQKRHVPAAETGDSFHSAEGRAAANLLGGGALLIAALTTRTKASRVLALAGGALGSRRAARKIVEACRRGKPEVVLTIPAKLAVRLQALFPQLTAAALELVAAALPKAGGRSAKRKRRAAVNGTKLAPSGTTQLHTMTPSGKPQHDRRGAR